ncbi:hypothetical protein COT98_04445 [Candidatus Falkowbacteria bacterium CG10_big_fil_rev_8_21_14_0_10_39_9]|uniref:Uncharacterized protein n=1 Tax=Candidatus Falkowbacteria bacterium CG10_big_fil_rev_8_21_14_0_10_39_9 TaxID=1974566 RepID=A0A2M6WN92_9BACT|nr:MAG: hypothetical protein COT98_04445 [Candidatus Falkowbacteria bacterium CG10_big_fil_rev_8_21_14_0_10_39_9]
MKKFWFFSKLVGALLLIVYSFSAIIYLLISICLLLEGQGADSLLERGRNWLWLHPLISLVLAIMIVPGLLIKYWDRIKKGIERRREENNSFYIKPRAEYRKK